MVLQFISHVHVLIVQPFLFPPFQSDPFFEISKSQEGGGFTVVHRSEPILKTLNPRYVVLYLLQVLKRLMIDYMYLIHVT